MANVVAKVTGGSPKDFVVGTVRELRAQMNLAETYKATIAGEPAEDSESLSDHDYVVFSPSSKGGNR